MKNNLFLIILFWCFPVYGVESLVRYKETPINVQNEKDHTNTYIPAYLYEGLDVPFEQLQCPVPPEDRVKNYTGIQCVYSSIETLGRWAEEPKLINPPLTSRSNCKGYSSPSRAAEVLKGLNVKFEQTYGDREKGINLIKKAMREGRGVLWDVPGHAMVLVHYDEIENKVCWIDNSDYSLKIQQTTVDRFKKRWSSWVLVVYADNDILPAKVYKYNLPIVDILNSDAQFSKNFVPFPKIR
jgi:hypothetical protein